MKVAIHEMSSPIGDLVLAIADDQVVWLSTDTSRAELEQYLADYFGHVVLGAASSSARLVSQLEDYFSGDIKAIDSIPIKAHGTPFQFAVWQKLRKVKAGTTVSYKELAGLAGSPDAQRAVGSAVRKNRIGIIIPCHRVISHDGGIGGYSSGLDPKRWLLDHEGAKLKSAKR